MLGHQGLITANSIQTNNRSSASCLYEKVGQQQRSHTTNTHKQTATSYLLTLPTHVEPRSENHAPAPVSEERRCWATTRNLQKEQAGQLKKIWASDSKLSNADKSAGKRETAWVRRLKQAKNLLEQRSAGNIFFGMQLSHSRLRQVLRRIRAQCSLKTESVRQWIGHCETLEAEQQRMLACWMRARQK